MRVVGYIRVSTARQVDGYSLKLQMSKIKEYCKLKEYDLVDVYEDAGKSGMLSSRDGYNDMIDYVKEHNVDGVVVYSLSRLGRKMKDVIDFLDMLKFNGKVFHSVKEGLSNDDSIGSLIVNILSSINQFEVEQTRQRIADVKQEKKSKGLVYGRLRYGYSNDKGRLVVNDNEMKVIKRIKNLRTRGYSWSMISKRLNNEQVPTKTGAKWNMGTLYNMMQTI
jgi:site-specific DNA recombinase